MKSRFFFLFLLIFHFIITHARNIDFEKFFNDSTLRIDYIFAGGPDGPGIFITSESKQPGWYGRRNKLESAPGKGYGSILVMDPITRDTLFHNTFSSLFQEWLLTSEAYEKPRSFENSFLLPLPKNKAEIKIEIRNNRQEPIATANHMYNPEDELISEVGTSPLSHTYVHKGGKPKEVIDIAIVAEGFKENEMDSFIFHAKRFANEILSYEPFSSNKDKFNFVAVMTPSEDSGASIPIKKEWKNTAFNSHFSTFHSPRYLTVPKIHDVHRSLEGIPYEHILIIVNTPEYGGGGIYNSYQVASANNQFTLPVTVHEFGHSFAGLADEYFYSDEENDFYPLDIEPWEPNITTLKDFSSKWEYLIDPLTPIPTSVNQDSETDRSSQINNYFNDMDKDSPVGLYEGGGYRIKGIFRPSLNCRMKNNNYPKFCPVCEKAIQEMIDFYIENP